MHVVRRREVDALSSKMLLQIAVTKIHGIFERFARIIKYLGNVADGHMDLAVVQTQLTRHRGFLLPSAKGVGAGDRRRRATTYGHCGFLVPSTKGVGMGDQRDGSLEGLERPSAWRRH